MVSVQRSLFDSGPTVELGALGGAERRELGDGAWLELTRGWVTGAGGLLERLVETVPWQAEQRRMYDRVVEVPRLVSFYDECDPLPDETVAAARDRLSRHHAAELGEPFVSVGMCLYRDGGDSVAWHGDRIGRGASEDTMVAILSLGSPRRFLLRPSGGGRSVRYVLGAGDLLVMGGSCQRTWEHAVPKSAGVGGARVSVQFRPRGVR